MKSCEKVCAHCGTSYRVIPARLASSKFCSKKCKWDHHGWSSEPNTKCTQCGVMFHIKESQKNRFKRTHGFFCSNACVGLFRRTGVYNGSKNPNYRGKTKDYDGYPLREYPAACNAVGGFKRMKLHQAVCCEALGVDRIGGGLHVHHRDCDVRDSSPGNLCVMTISDHKWIHKQFGNATLWAHAHGKIETSELASWSDDPERASRLLDLTVSDQSADALGVVVDGYLKAYQLTATKE